MAIELLHTDQFVDRHIGLTEEDIQDLLDTLGLSSLDDLVEKTVPDSIRSSAPLRLPPARTEHAVLSELQSKAAQNQVFRSFIGMGYYDTITPRRHNACCAGKSLLVYPIHALPGGDISRAPRSIAELPDNGYRLNRSGHC